MGGRATHALPAAALAYKNPRLSTMLCCASWPCPRLPHPLSTTSNAGVNPTRQMCRNDKCMMHPLKHTCSSPTVLRPLSTSSRVDLPLPEGLHLGDGGQKRECHNVLA